MKSDTIITHSLFMRSTDGTGRTAVHEHRVWDKNRFIAARNADAVTANAKDGTTQQKFEQITEQQYKKERK